MKPELSIIPEPDRSTEARKPLTRRQSLQLMLDQNGRCGCGCGVKLDPMGEGVIDEHLTALELTGPNDLANRSLYRKPCAKAKTSGKDAPAIAKAKRITARETGTRRPRKAIPSAGFSDRTRKMDGTIGLTAKAARYIASRKDADQ
jgi:hypothetical protein